MTCSRAASGNAIRSSHVRFAAVLCWQLLTREQDYAYQRPTLVARKLRTLELRAGAPHARTTSTAARASTAKQRAAQERQLAEQAEHAYRRLIADWKATGPNKGAGAAPGRASQGSSSDQAARQAPASEPALLPAVTRTTNNDPKPQRIRPCSRDFHA
ncbi:MAG: hypothetical protein LC790_01960 [Actinobacteria bacterium]|nr:hypothetical protein [Actinomycetota bacterium]MCA1697719.1 hypothetical protein [Actinomycetota bacterium]